MCTTTRTGGPSALAVWLRTAVVVAAKQLWKLLGREPAWKYIPGTGLMKLRPDEFADARLYFFECWEPTLSALVAGELPKGAVAIDIGAGTGYYTLLMARRVGEDGRVYSLEPTETMRRRLEENIAANNFDAIVVVPFGCAGPAGAETAGTPEPEKSLTDVVGPATSASLLRAFREAVRDGDAARIAVIRLSLGDLEADLLAGLLALSDAFSPELLIICDAYRPASLRPLLPRFRAAGYAAYAVENDSRLIRYVSSTAAGEIRPLDDLPCGRSAVAFKRGTPLRLPA